MTSEPTIKVKYDKGWYEKGMTEVNTISDDNPKLIILAQDKVNSKDDKKKRYKIFEDFAHLERFITNERKKGTKICYYECIKTKEKTPVYLYMDLDRPYYHTKEKLEEQDVLSALIPMIERRLEEDCGIVMKLLEGENYQVSSSCYDKKFSLHLKFNLLFANSSLVSKLVSNLRGMVGERPEWKEMFQYIKIKSNGKPENEMMMDESVYKNNQLFRMLYSCKRSKGIPLIPYGKSSIEWRDHLVVFYPDNPQPCLFKTMVSCVETRNSLSKPSKQIITSLPRQPDIDFLPTKSLSSIPLKHIEKVRDFIENDKTIQAFMGGNVRISYTRPKKDAKKVIFYVKNHVCQYSKCIHKSNHSFFEYNYPSNILLYKCFDEVCQADWSKNGTYPFKIPHFDDCSISYNTLHTIHDKRDVIEWNETYCESKMREYPHVPLAVIVAQMGLGKTEQLSYYFKKYLKKGKSCLIISYSINLTRKYMEELGYSYDFKLYLDDKSGKLNHPRLIVCLDSLYKIDLKKYDFVIIDEVVSVLGHINADTMTKRAEVMMTFQEVLLNAKNVLMLDAGADNTITYSVVEYLAEKKKIKPYWIHNTFIRPHNRKCKIYVKNGQLRKKDDRDREFESCILTYIHSRISAGKNLVIPCASKSMADEISMSITDKYGADFPQMLYTSNTDADIKKEHFRDTHSYWGNYRVLIYSPTISAGVSFCPKIAHYHELIGVLENSLFVPDVMGQLQMLFRVRQLIDGQMTLFVRNNTFKISSSYPVVESEIEKFLDDNITNLDLYYPKVKNVDGVRTSIINTRADLQTNNKTNNIQYDKSKMSYPLMKSVVLNYNKSLLYFVEILSDTIEKDYNIEVERVNYKDAEYEFYEKAILIGTYEFKEWTTYVIDDEQYKSLCLSETRGYELSQDEKIQKQVYKILVERYEVNPSRFDEHLVNGIARFCSEQKTIKELYDQLWTRKRLYDCMTKSNQENRRTFFHKISNLLENSDEKGRKRDETIELALIYKKKEVIHLKKIVLGQEILYAIIPNYKDLEMGDVMTTREIVSNRIGLFLQTKDQKWFDDVRKVFNLDKRTYKSFETMFKQHLNFISTVMREAFGIVVHLELFTTNPLREGYGKKDIISLSAWLWNDYKRKYRPFEASKPFIDVVMKGYSFVNDEDIIISIPPSIKELLRPYNFDNYYKELPLDVQTHIQKKVFDGVIDELNVKGKEIVRNRWIKAMVKYSYSSYYAVEVERQVACFLSPRYNSDVFDVFKFLGDVYDIPRKQMEEWATTYADLLDITDVETKLKHLKLCYTFINDTSCYLFNRDDKYTDEDKALFNPFFTRQINLEMKDEAMVVLKAKLRTTSLRRCCVNFACYSWDYFSIMFEVFECCIDV